jgi:hypothetical protein
MFIIPQPNPTLAERRKRQQNLKARIGHYLDRHPEVPPDQFFLEAVGHEIDRCEGCGQSTRRQTVDRVARRPRPTTEDVRLHAWLADRLVIVTRRRRSFWRRLATFLGL